MKVDTFGGTVHVEWDPDAAATPLGHLAFFAEYLKVSGRFDGWWRTGCTTRARTRRRSGTGNGASVGRSAMRSRRCAATGSIRRCWACRARILFGAAWTIEAEDGTSAISRHGAAVLSEPWRLRHDDQASLRPPGGGATTRKPGRPSHAYHACRWRARALCWTLMLRRATVIARRARRPRCGPCLSASGGSTGRASGATRMGQRGQHGVGEGAGLDLFKPDEGSAPACRAPWRVMSGRTHKAGRSRPAPAGRRVAWLCCAVACRGRWR